MTEKVESSITGRSMHCCSSQKKTLSYYDSDFEFSEVLEAGKAFDRDIVASLTSEEEIEGKEEEEEYGEVWETFHTTQGSKFFPRKRYVPLAFPEIGREVKRKTGSVLALGCGTGSSILAILKYWDHIEVACFDVARKAVDIFLSRSKDEDLSSRVLGTEIFDLASDTTEAAPPSIMSNVPFDTLTLIFVLSAIHPKHHIRALQRARSFGSKGNTLLCFRDYGLYDMTMLRSKHTQVVKSEDDSDSGPPRLFRRGDRTLRYFFSLEYVRHIFKTAGWKCVRLDYSRVVNKNRRTGQVLKRVFVTGVFRMEMT